MTLAFSTYLDGRPTHFVEKIWEFLLTSDLEFDLKDFSSYLSKVPGLGKYVVGDLPAKLHTIRKDEKARWRAGRDIHMVIHNRTPKRFQFAPVVKCVSVQEIEIKYKEEENRTTATVSIDGFSRGMVTWLDGGGIFEFTLNLQQLAYNDGFDSIEAFFEYFNKDFTGKIIHWTNLKY